MGTVLFVKNALATTLNGRMYATAHINPVVALDNTPESLIEKKLLRSYPKVVDYFLKKIARDQAIAERDSKILRSIHPAHMPPTQYANDHYEKSCRVADVHGESTLNNIFVEGVDPSICHSVPEYLATLSQTDVTDIAFMVQSLLANQKRANKWANTNN